MVPCQVARIIVVVTGTESVFKRDYYGTHTYNTYNDVVECVYHKSKSNANANTSANPQAIHSGGGSQQSALQYNGPLRFVDFMHIDTNTGKDGDTLVVDLHRFHFTEGGGGEHVGHSHNYNHGQKQKQTKAKAKSKGEPREIRVAFRAKEAEDDEDGNDGSINPLVTGSTNTTVI